MIGFWYRDSNQEGVKSASSSIGDGHVLNLKDGDTKQMGLC